MTVIQKLVLANYSILIDIHTKPLINMLYVPSSHILAAQCQRDQLTRPPHGVFAHRFEISADKRIPITAVGLIYTRLDPSSISLIFGTLASITHVILVEYT